MQDNRNTRKVREGVVISNKMQKTVTVRVERTVRHGDFDKIVSRTKKYYAHVEDAQKVPVGQRSSMGCSFFSAHGKRLHFHHRHGNDFISTIDMEKLLSPSGCRPRS